MGNTINPIATMSNGIVFWDVFIAFFYRQIRTFTVCTNGIYYIPKFTNYGYTMDVHVLVGFRLWTDSQLKFVWEFVLGKRFAIKKVFGFSLANWLAIISPPISLKRQERSDIPWSVIESILEYFRRIVFDPFSFRYKQFKEESVHRKIVY